MSKSARGDAVHPGKNVKAKSGLNKSILDQGWSELKRQLEYKLNWLGGKLLLVPAQYTSQTCPKENCRHVSSENRKTQREFCCVKCGHQAHADVVGAKNVLRAGHAQLACGDIADISLQAQESPTVAA